MEKKIEDYINFYLGCECEYMEEIDDIPRIKPLTGYMIGRGFYWVKPILRRLADLTEDEAKEGNLAAFEFRVIKKEVMSYAFTPNRFVWLLSKHFDLFGLIEAGLALEKSKIISPNTK